MKSRAGQVQTRFQLLGKGSVLVQGRAIGSRIGRGRARVTRAAAQMGKVETGDVLITEMTDPDWGPVMNAPQLSSPTAAGVSVTPPSLPANWVFQRWSRQVMPQ